jgi:hypothetical protein
MNSLNGSYKSNDDKTKGKQSKIYKRYILFKLKCLYNLESVQIFKSNYMANCNLKLIKNRYSTMLFLVFSSLSINKVQIIINY